MDRQPTLEGERLLLRLLRAEDWDALYSVAADPLIWEVHPRHDRWQKPVFREFFDDALAKGGALVVIDKSSGAIIGSSRYQESRPEDGGSVEIGWTFLARSYWGGSYNRELKRLMLAHALASVGRAVFVVGEHNVRSRAAMVKIGGRLTDETRVIATPQGPSRNVIFVIDREGFANGPLS